MKNGKVNTMKDIECAIESAYAFKYCSIFQRINNETPKYEELKDIILTDEKHKKKLFDFLCECSEQCRVDLDSGIISFECDIHPDKILTIQDIANELYKNMKKYGAKTEEEWYASE